MVRSHRPVGTAITAFASATLMGVLGPFDFLLCIAIGELRVWGANRSLPGYIAVAIFTGKPPEEKRTVA